MDSLARCGDNGLDGRTGSTHDPWAMHDTLTFTQTVPSSTDRVWQVLSMHSEIAPWWAPGDMTPVAMHKTAYEGMGRGWPMILAKLASCA